jgi:uncharacterized caspase-like protein
MFDLLSSRGYQINNSHNLIGYVTWEKMRDGIINFFTDSTIKPTDTLLFYYSGHGVPDVDGDVYFATSEIDHYLPYKRGFSFNELAKMIQRTISTRVVVILDCCYSGSATLSKGHEDDAARLGTAAIDNGSRILQGEGRCLLAASQALQEAYVLEEQNQSLFTYYILRGLQGKDREVFDQRGNVTVDTLSKYVYDKIMSLPLDKRPKQRPLRKIESSGDIILIDSSHFADIKKGARALTRSESKIQYKDQEIVKNPSVAEVENFINNAKQATTHTAKFLAFSKFIGNVYGVKVDELIPGIEKKIGSKILAFRGSIDLLFSYVILEFKTNFARLLYSMYDSIVWASSR